MYEEFGEVEEMPEKPETASDDIHRHLRESDAPPKGHGAFEDIRVSDDSGHMLTLRTEDGSRARLDQVYETDTAITRHPIRVRVFDGDRQTGYANLTLEVEKEFNTASGHYDQVADSRMRLNDIHVQEEYRGRGLGSMMLEHGEALSRRARAREIYGVPETEQAEGFFDRQGHSFRTNESGVLEHYKPFYFK